MTRETPAEQKAQRAYEQARENLAALVRNGPSMRVIDPAYDLDRWIAEATEKRQRAREQLEVTRMSVKAEEIRKRTVARLREIAQQMSALGMRDPDGREEFGVKGERLVKARGDLRHRWRIAEEQAFAEMGEWVESSMAAAQALYESDPIGDAATESRRVADELAIANIATPFVGQSATMVKNHLLSEARRLIASNAPDRARVYVEAARRAGVTDSRLDHALTEAFDRTVPHRREAKKQMDEILLQRDLLRNDVYSERIVNKVGSLSEQASASVAVKMHAFRQQQLAEQAGQEGGAE